MFNRIAKSWIAPSLLIIGMCSVSPSHAADAAWRVSKSTGDVWITISGAQQASLTGDSVLNPGDSIRTGRNGRVLLVRGQERILISPNSVIGLPPVQNEGRATTIIQQSGSILLEVERRNVQHFEVETPYLAAVVRGTQFRVSVGQEESYVNVLRGQVEVADFRSGQLANVLAGQMAKVWALGVAGLSLSGSGTLGVIRQGNPRTSSVAPVDIPVEGLQAPVTAAPGQQVRVAQPSGDAASFPMEFGGREFNDSVWNASGDYLNRMIGRGDGSANRGESDLLIMSIPLAFGTIIAAAVAAMRRRRKSMLT